MHRGVFFKNFNYAVKASLELAAFKSARDR